MYHLIIFLAQDLLASLQFTIRSLRQWIPHFQQALSIDVRACGSGMSRSLLNAQERRLGC